jgi:hypothetical protein
MQPVSREERDFEVKSSMQEEKQWSTTLPKIWSGGGASVNAWRGSFGAGTDVLRLVGSLGGGGAYVHELLDLALLEALLELVLLGFRESGRG